MFLFFMENKYFNFVFVIKQVSRLLYRIMSYFVSLYRQMDLITIENTVYFVVKYVYFLVIFVKDTD